MLLDGQNIVDPFESPLGRPDGLPFLLEITHD
jgi:hypothetical protein